MQQQKYQAQWSSQTLPAVSLVETIVAMVIVTVAFAGGMLLFMNVLRNEQLPLRTEAAIHLQHLLIQTQEESRYLDESYETNGFAVVKKISTYGQEPDNIRVHLRATSHQGQVLHEIQEVIYYPSPEEKE